MRAGQQGKARLATGLDRDYHWPLVAHRTAAVRICDQRSCEREQTDCEHDERAMQMSDLAHDSLLSGFVCAPVTLDPTSNRSTIGG